MARVYVSSTYQDLKEHREAVRSAVRRMGHVDVAMEHYVAADDRPLDRCLVDVREADLYVVVMAWRHGFVPAGGTLSITELEYREAVAEGKPVLAFVLSDEHPWPPKWVEHGPDVARFRAELLDSHLAGVFTTVDDLGRQVTEALQAHSAQPTSAVDWDLYRQAVADRYRWVRLSVIAGAQDERFAKIPLTDVFVPQELRLGRPDYDVASDEVDITEPLDASSTIGSTGRQVLLGGPGSGKSTLFHSFMLALCDTSRVPLLVELRQYALSDSDDFVTFLEKQVMATLGVCVSGDAITDVLLRGEAVVLFDGLDEVFDPAKRAYVTEQLFAFTTRFPKVRAVVSSRIVGYDDTELHARGFDHYTVLDFNLRQIKEFVPRWYEHYTLEGDKRDAADLIRRIVDNPRLLELAGNPLLLTMMAIIYKHQDLPEKRWQLYARCTGVLLEHWDVKRKKIGAREALRLDFAVGMDQKAEILERIAHRMLRENQEGELNAIAYVPLRDEVAAYLESQYERSPADARALAVEILNHLRERTYVLAEIGDGVFGFVHRTFMEYFAARHVLAQFNGRKADYRWLKDVYDAHWDRDQWREPLLLLSGMLAGQGSPVREVVDHLARAPRALVFAARCLTETGQVPPDDRSWAGRLLGALVNRTGELLGKRNTGAQVAEHVEAFTQLVAMSSPTRHTRERIEAMKASSSTNERITGWQLDFATVPRSERREVAMQNLSADDEAVRRATVRVLEHGWAGDEAVLVRLLAALSVEHVGVVSQALVTVIDRSWPERRELIELLGAAHIYPYTYLLWLVDHLATTWSGDLVVRDVVRDAVEPLHLELEHGFAAEEAVCRALVKGWGTVPDMADYLRRGLHDENQRKNYIAVRTLIELGADCIFGEPLLPLAARQYIVARLCTDSLQELRVLRWVLELAEDDELGDFTIETLDKAAKRSSRFLLRLYGIRALEPGTLAGACATRLIERRRRTLGGRMPMPPLMIQLHLWEFRRWDSRYIRSIDYVDVLTVVGLVSCIPDDANDALLRMRAEAEEVLRVVRQNRSREHQLGR